MCSFQTTGLPVVTGGDEIPRKRFSKGRFLSFYRTSLISEALFTRPCFSSLSEKPGSSALYCPRAVIGTFPPLNFHPFSSEASIPKPAQKTPEQSITYKYTLTGNGLPLVIGGIIKYQNAQLLWTSEMMRELFHHLHLSNVGGEHLQI